MKDMSMCTYRFSIGQARLLRERALACRQATSRIEPCAHELGLSDEPPIKEMTHCNRYDCLGALASSGC